MYGTSTNHRSRHDYTCKGPRPWVVHGLSLPRLFPTQRKVFLPSPGRLDLDRVDWAFQIAPRIDIRGLHGGRTLEARAGGILWIDDPVWNQPWWVWLVILSFVLTFWIGGGSSRSYQSIVSSLWWLILLSPMIHTMRLPGCLNPAGPCLCSYWSGRAHSSLT